MTSDRTKSLIKKYRVFKWLDIACWVGIAIFTFISVLCLINGTDEKGTPIFSQEFKAFLVSLGVTTIVGIIAALIIKDKMRTAIWMLSLILCTVMYKEVGMYCILGAWFIDEYIFHALKVKYKNLIVINKEIDRR